MDFKDYYAALGVSKTASADEIKKTYRTQARKYHPDINHAPEAEKKFKEISEAYEVLSDPEKRKKYDQLGADWKAGRQWQPPPGGRGSGRSYTYRSGGGSSDPFSGDDMGGFSDFFESIFGGMGGQSQGRPRARQTWRRKGSDHEADMEITLEEAVNGITRPISLQKTDVNAHGQPQQQNVTLNVTIPPGTGQNSRIRLAQQGGAGSGGAPSGDLYLHVIIKHHNRFKLNGRNLHADLCVTPWEAALGAKINFKTIRGRTMVVTLPPGTSSGSQMRFKGQGMSASGTKHAGDLLLTIRIMIPKKLTDAETRLFKQLAEQSSFDPRKE
ncbi:MAG: J domain-containing protein [Spartobacteria bacterium]|nr:J domain-containing protein [Spartobacteria bacterium]